MSADDLDLLPVDDLIGALTRRFDAGVFIACTRLTTGDLNYSLRYFGEEIQCIGLATYAATDIAGTIDKGPQD